MATELGSAGESTAARVAIAATGLLLVVFLVLHLAGVALALGDPARFEAWATALHQLPVLPVLEGALAVAAAGHAALTLRRVMRNRRAVGAQPPSLRRSRRAAAGAGEALAAAAARWAPWSGALLLAFLVVHLLQLRWHRPMAGAELAALEAVLRSPLNFFLYGGAGIAAGLHLFHGLEAAYRSLGWLEPARRELLRRGGRFLALALGGGFALVSMALPLVEALR
ncbi:MAG: succinate dehydrogenase [Prochlorococcaceae cyanobacterium]|jgi:succinate dehydrogenase / fumarate reductase cytochrome b subunit